MIEQIGLHKIVQDGNANDKVNFSLRLSLMDGSIEADSSLREITFEDLKQFMPKEGVVFIREKQSDKTTARQFGISG